MPSCSSFKRALSVTLLIFFTLSAVWSAAAEEKSIVPITSCKYCGMSKQGHEDTWMIVTYEEGLGSEVCSIHCAAIDLALHNNYALHLITVGDAITKKQIDAEMAYWIIGGSKESAMTTTAKWAFKHRAAAEGFIRRYGGRPATFEDVLEAAFEDMYLDIQTIRKMRRLEESRKESD